MLKIKNRIILYILLILAIFQLVVLATAIDVGSLATNRSSSDSGYTNVDMANPADYTGTITSIKIWANGDMTGLKVGTFSASGDDLTVRDTEVIPGTVLEGAERTYVVDIDVVAGDYIGCYFTGGSIDYDSSGGSGVWYLSGDHMDASSETFTEAEADAQSLYGIGATAEEGGTHIFFTFSDF